MRLLEPGEPLPRDLRATGPDLLGDEVEPGPATARALGRLEPTRQVGEALLDQRVVAGVGNVYKSEACFLSGIDPWRPVGSLSQKEAAALGSVAARLLPRACATGGRSAPGARPTRPLAPASAPGSTGGPGGPAAAAGAASARAGRATPTAPPTGAPLPALTRRQAGGRGAASRRAGPHLDDLLVQLGADQQRDAGEEEEDQVDRGAGQRAVDALGRPKFST